MLKRYLKKTAKRKLRQAADLLEDGELGPRWNQYQLYSIDKHGRETYCAIGALNQVIYGVPDPYIPKNPAKNAQYKIARYALANLVVGRNIANWNDVYAKNAEEVIAKFREAADKL